MKSAILAIMGTMAAAPVWAALPEPIRVDGGQITGTPAYAFGVRAYRGIPYAAPPVGNLRWRPPQPVIPWEGVRAADHFSAACMQVPPRSQNDVFWNDGMSPSSEDCLYLNVWTPAKSASARLPVMVWFHGGGLWQGAASEVYYDPSMLAKKGVVVVNMNYRLGVFGFLAHPELTRESERHVSGNYGFLDQFTALTWVRNNIAQFGGDPASVTIAGQSAGSASVEYHVASPRAKGLFKRAIAQSSAWFGPMTTDLARGEAMGAAFAKQAGAPSLAALRAMKAEDVAAAAIKQGRMTTGIVDGWYLPQDFYTIFSAGRQNDVPLLTGSTNDEGSLQGPSPDTVAAYVEAARKNFGDLADEFLKLYPVRSDADVKQAFHDANRDSTFANPRTWAQLQTKTGKSGAYLYIFSQTPPYLAGDALPPMPRGAIHGTDCFYMFNNLHNKDWPWTEMDRKVGETMSSYWANFVKTGDPNGAGLPRWPAYNSQDGQALNIGNPVRVETLNQARLDFFSKVNRQRMPPVR